MKPGNWYTLAKEHMVCEICNKPFINDEGGLVHWLGEGKPTFPSNNEGNDHVVVCNGCCEEHTTTKLNGYFTCGCGG